MLISCPNCNKKITLDENKLPSNKKKATVKCPQCDKNLIFSLPLPVTTYHKTKNEPTQVIFTKNSENIAQSDFVKLKDIEGGREFQLRNGINTIGRKGTIKIDNDDKYISRIHCAIEIKNRNNKREIILSDTGEHSPDLKPSSNGTFYNNYRLSSHDKIILNHGDFVRIGNTSFQVL